MKVYAPLLFVVVSLFISQESLAVAGKVYRWTDSNGLIHYSETPPFNVHAELIRTQTGKSDPTESTAAAAKDKPKVEKKEPAAAKADAPPKDKERCDNARKNVASLTTYTHIKVKDDNGQYRYLTPEEQQQKLKESNLAIEESCE